MESLTHGNKSTYVNHRCRCDDCRRAWAQYIRNLRIRKAHGMPVAARRRNAAA
jgi:hypothetical protein